MGRTQARIIFWTLIIILAVLATIGGVDFYKNKLIDGQVEKAQTRVFAAQSFKRDIQISRLLVSVNSDFAQKKEFIAELDEQLNGANKLLTDANKILADAEKVQKRNLKTISNEATDFGNK